jgi:hypothetical protein
MFRPWKGVLSVGLVLAALPAGSAMAQVPDTTPPTITVVTPAEGGTYTQGQPATASYTCADDVAVQSCAGPVANGGAISTATVGSFDFKVDATDTAGNTASVTRHYSVVPVTGTPGGETPATLNITLGASSPFAPFIPGIAKDYTTTVAATLTSTAGDATLWVADPSAANTGKLVNGSFALTQPLQGLGTLKTWTAPTSNESVPITFKQAITANEPLRTGTYSKTLTFTLSTTTP